MIPELTFLVWSVALLLIHIALQATVGIFDKGFLYSLGSQDEPKEVASITSRLNRSLVNFLQTYPAYIALALTLAITNTATETTAMGAMIWFWARVAYIPAYLSGIPLVRTLVWAASVVGLVIMLLPLLLS